MQSAMQELAHSKLHVPSAGDAPELHVGGKFRLGPKLGVGSFGTIYIGTDKDTGEEVAIKLEPVHSESPQLRYESMVLCVVGGCTGFPRLRWCGVEGAFNVMVLDLLGPSLEDLFSFCGRKFTLKTALMIADQLLTRLQHMHEQDYVHRDIKPDNILIGRWKTVNDMHLIDFGLAKRYRQQKTQKHIPCQLHRNLTGTATFASINSHLGLEQSRRDDLEAAGYVLIYFLRGSLPWQHLQGGSRTDVHRRILRVKASTPPEVLCQSFPPELTTYFKYCRGLGFKDDPDYAYLRNLLQGLFLREGYERDCIFDWTVL
mmetsp:Transcript_47615/g.110294  ORF Transcript_47615/g.110294 Transcript_47615/m.110294 type:complete len:315 (-) Transcript_47615:87-1031(-)